jgi:protein gp37
MRLRRAEGMTKRERSVPVFFKQWGGTNKKKAGKHLDGRTWDQMPTIHP